MRLGKQSTRMERSPPAQLRGGSVGNGWAAARRERHAWRAGSVSERRALRWILALVGERLLLGGGRSRGTLRSLTLPARLLIGYNEVMELPIQFPDYADEIRRDAEEFRSLSADERLRIMTS